MGKNTLVNTSKYFKFTIKLIFGLAVLCFVGWKIIALIKTNLLTELNVSKHWIIQFLLVALLMVVNWSIEAIKWKKLIENLKKLNFKAALSAVLAGISTGIITPNRLGNFIGRTVYLDQKIKVKATFLTLLANLSQFVITLFFGCIGLLFIGADSFGFSKWFLFLGGILLLFLGMLIYLNPRLINRKPFNYFFPLKITEGVDYISESSTGLKLQIIGLSGLRYLVFVSQYVLLLMAFNQNQEIILMYASIMVVYLLMTLIPSLFFGKLFVREAAALLVLASINVPDSVILISGFVLWLFNIALPALVGASLLIKKR